MAEALKRTFAFGRSVTRARVVGARRRWRGAPDVPDARRVRMSRAAHRMADADPARKAVSAMRRPAASFSIGSRA
ncbi:Uncharacterised protein [Burkholderia oklahomensis]|nr:hypothetical protein BG90_5684 [Burkholderia oklahomensis C6786]AOI49310.1 hypothetical protein WI23_26380 [Burkholderia oklahomensis C6786]KUY60643.1 hypothetical protein WI23_13125 [Burkholderia oklahomensis C6786]SUY26548.1 Uncharacterised protein [Burkholderia oklahomensis]